LRIIITTRNRQKSYDTISRLCSHLRNRAARLRALSDGRISFLPEILDLTSLRSVQQLSRKLLLSTPKLDVLVLNAGYGGFTGIDWPLGIWTVLTDLKYSVTWPRFKKSGVGLVVKPQLISNDENTNGPRSSSRAKFQSHEPPLGEVFCSNVFGHYLLTHNLGPLLSDRSNPSNAPGRIIWISSVEAYARSLSISDIQGLHSPQAYECSKRLTDVLALTASLPSTSPWTARFLTPPASPISPASKPSPTAPKPRMYLAQPGICATSMVPLPLILYYCMTAAFYIARWLGSPWHTVSAYTGACAPVWLALAPQTQLDAMEEEGGPGKWGSSTDTSGHERVARTEVEGWGYGGLVGEKGEGRKGRMRGAKDLTREGKEEFEELGRLCWKKMEELREEWEERLAGTGESL